MTEKRFKVLSGGFDEEGNPLYLIKDTTDMIGDYEICMKVIKQQATISALKEENEQLKQLLKEAEDEIENLKKSNKGLMESIVENDFNKAQFVEFLLRIRESGLCDGCKNKDKPVEWYMERGISITAGSCNRYEPED